MTPGRVPPRLVALPEETPTPDVVSDRVSRNGARAVVLPGADPVETGPGTHQLTHRI